MTDPYREHPNEEALERFLLKNSSAEELEVVETHLFACEACVEHLEALETQIAATKLALASLEAKRILKETAKISGTWRSWFTTPRLSYATAFAGLVLGAIIFSLPRDVTITAYRGSETVIVSQWRPLHLHLNAAGLPAGPTSVEIVDVNGSTIWRGTPSSLTTPSIPPYPGSRGPDNTSCGFTQSPGMVTIRNYYANSLYKRSLFYSFQSFKIPVYVDGQP